MNERITTEWVTSPINLPSLLMIGIRWMLARSIVSAISLIEVFSLLVITLVVIRSSAKRSLVLSPARSISRRVIMHACYGYPQESMYKQSLYTDFSSIKRKIENSEDLIARDRKKEEIFTFSLLKKMRKRLEQASFMVALSLIAIFFRITSKQEKQ